MKTGKYIKRDNPKVIMIVDTIVDGKAEFHEEGFLVAFKTPVDAFIKKYKPVGEKVLEPVELDAFSKRNLDVIENFILHFTHVSPGDHNENERMYATPAELYQAADDYIDEDHVDGMGREKDPVDLKPDGYRILTARSASELQSKVAELQDEGWCSDGPHQVVMKDSYEQYSGKQHMATKCNYEYSQTMTH